MIAALLLFTLALLALPLSEPHLFPHLVGFESLLIAAGLYALVERRTPFSVPDIKAPKRTSALLIVAGMLLLFLLPMRRIVAPPEGAGDSLWLVELLPLSAELTGYWSSFDEILEPLMRSLSYRLISYLWGPDFSGFILFSADISDSHVAGSLLLAGDFERIFLSLGLYSYVCGLIQLMAIVFFLRNRPLRSQIRGFLLLFCVPATQLFAGYIEHYAFSSMSITVILLLVWSDLDSASSVKSGAPRQAGLTGRFAPPIIAALAALAVLHHLIAGFLLPGLIYYLWLRNGGNVRTFVKEASLSLLIALIALSAGWYLYFEVLQLTIAGSHLMHPPLLSLHKIVSSMNLVKILFVLLLCAPATFAFPSLLFRRSADAAEKVVAVIAFTYGIQLTIWNPVIGLPADWDLLSVVAFPLHVLIFMRSEKTPDHMRLGSLAAVTLLPALLWFQYNHRDDNEQARRALRTAQAVLIELKDDSHWTSLRSERKRELMLLHLFVEKSNGDRSKARSLLKRARQAEDDRSYNEALDELRSMLAP